LSTILTSVLPLFTVIFVGFGAGKLAMLDERDIKTLVAFVFNLAMPALLFRLMANTEIGGIQDWSLFAAYLAAQIPVFLLGMGIGRIVFDQRLAAMTIQGFGSAFANSVLLGLPLALMLYGEAGGVPALMIIVLDVLIFSVVTLLLEVGTRDPTARDGRHILLQIALSIVKNPLITATFLGVLAALAGLHLPGTVDKTLAFIGQAGPPAGLFALGVSLSLRPIAGSLGAVGAMVGAKLLIHPALAWLVVTFLFPDLDPLYKFVAVLLAACPVGANTYVFAQQYEAEVETSSTAVLVSTALALFTVSTLLLVLAPVDG
jgi:predicted permease